MSRKIVTAAGGRRAGPGCSELYSGFAEAALAQFVRRSAGELGAMNAGWYSWIS